MIAVQGGDSALAREQYEAITTTPGADLMMLHGMIPQHLLGLLAQTMGTGDLAEEHFEQALTFCRNAGYRARLAWACCDYADVLRERNGEGERAKATSPEITFIFTQCTQ